MFNLFIYILFLCIALKDSCYRDSANSSYILPFDQTKPNRAKSVMISE